MEQAKNAGDFEGYFQARTKLENLSRSGYREFPDEQKKSFKEFFQTSEMKAVNENATSDLKNFPAYLLGPLELEEGDELSYGRRTPHGHSRTKRTLYSRVPGGKWESRGDALAYHPGDIADAVRFNVRYTEKETLIHTLLEKRRSRIEYNRNSI